MLEHVPAGLVQTAYREQAVNGYCPRHVVIRLKGVLHKQGIASVANLSSLACQVEPKPTSMQSLFRSLGAFLFMPGVPVSLPGVASVVSKGG